jgi:hypothetical protein
MSDVALPVWTCEFKGTENLTVGTKFNVACGGDIPVQWNEGPLNVVFPQKEQSYTLVVLKADKLEAQRAELTVTGYKPGEHNPEYMRIVQGEAGFEVLKPKWTIASVLKQGEPPQPVPPFGPWALSLPMWVLIFQLVVFLFLLWIGYRIFRRYTQRNKIQQELDRHKTALPPVNQFYKDARHLRRRLNNAQSAEELKSITNELNKEFRLYVLRKFQIPALDWSDSAIVGSLKKRHRKIYKLASDPLRKTLRELSRMTHQEHPLLPDVEQIHRMTLDAVERMEYTR